MLRTLIIEIGRCGFGRDAGPPPSIRLGVVRIWRSPAGLLARLRSYDDALRAASEKLKRNGR